MQRSTESPTKLVKKRDDVFEFVDGDKCRILTSRSGTQSQHRTGNYAKRSLRSYKQLLEVITRIVFEHSI